MLRKKSYKFSGCFLCAYIHIFSLLFAFFNFRFCVFYILCRYNVVLIWLCVHSMRAHFSCKMSFCLYYCFCVCLCVYSKLMLLQIFPLLLYFYIISFYYIFFIWAFVLRKQFYSFLRFLFCYYCCCLVFKQQDERRKKLSYNLHAHCIWCASYYQYQSSSILFFIQEFISLLNCILYS